MSNFSKYTIVAGDTLSMVAQKTLGDATRSMELAIINDLNYPFIVEIWEETTEEGVKRPGDTLLIPSGVSPYDPVELPILDDPFGTDLLLTTDKQNLSFGISGEFETNLYGDLKTVSGVTSLKQDLIHRLVTEVGTLPYHPEYGSNILRIIGNKNDSTWRDKAVIEVNRTFRSDHRVADVTNTQVTDLGVGMVISCIIVTSSSSFDLEYTMESEVQANGSQDENIQ